MLVVYMQNPLQVSSFSGKSVSSDKTARISMIEASADGVPTISVVLSGIMHEIEGHSPSYIPQCLCILDETNTLVETTCI